MVRHSYSASGERRYIPSRQCGTVKVSSESLASLKVFEQKSGAIMYVFKDCKHIWDGYFGCKEAVKLL